MVRSSARYQCKECDFYTDDYDDWVDHVCDDAESEKYQDEGGD